MRCSTDTSWSYYHNAWRWDFNSSVLIVFELFSDKLFPYIVWVSTESVTPLVDVHFLGRVWIAPEQEPFILKRNRTVWPLVSLFALKQQSILVYVAHDLLSVINSWAEWVNLADGAVYQHFFVDADVHRDELRPSWFRFHLFFNTLRVGTHRGEFCLQFFNEHIVCCYHFVCLSLSLDCLVLSLLLAQVVKLDNLVKHDALVLCIDQALEYLLWLGWEYTVGEDEPTLFNFFFPEWLWQSVIFGSQLWILIFIQFFDLFQVYLLIFAILVRFTLFVWFFSFVIRCGSP